MKRILLILFILFTAVFPSWTQEYCRTTWPYLYEHFTTGKVYLLGGGITEAEVNVSVADNKLHFMEDGVIKEADMEKVLLAEINDDTYTQVDGLFLKQMAQGPKGMIAALIEADIAKISETPGAYGSSGTTMATSKISNIAFSNFDNMTQTNVHRVNEGGKQLELKKTYYVICKGHLQKAVRSTILRSLDKKQKKEFLAFLRNHHINWGEPESMLALTDYFYGI